MSNSSLFTLAAYEGIEDQKYIFAAVLILLYPVTLSANVLLIYVICVEKSLHKPMYIFICNLACIGLYGASGLAPFLLNRLLNGDTHISRVSCLLQIFNLNTYGGCEIANLMVMAYDRYVSVCFPLSYERMMSFSKVVASVAFVWLFPFCRCTVTLSITAQLELCGSIIEKVYCDNFSVVKLSCSGISQINIYSSTVTFVSVVLPFFVILYSYSRIIFISLNLTKGKQKKVLSTCIPHLVVILNFLLGASFELFQSRFDMTHLPYAIRVVLSLYFLLFSPVLNPIIYGAKTQKINAALKKMWFVNCKIRKQLDVNTFRALFTKTFSMCKKPFSICKKSVT